MKPLDNYAALMPFIDSWEAGQADFLGGLLYDTLHPTSVIDWGCASGLYLIPFFARGCRILGLDADPGAGRRLKSWEFSRCDFRELNVYTSMVPSDLALCIEVAEHLQPEYADVLVDNVSDSARAIFWSAAHPGQGGDNHYNEQPPEYWLGKFERRGFSLYPENDRVRAEIAANPECQKVQWLLPNARLLHRSS